MKKDTPSRYAIQLFSDEDVDTPLPLLTARQWGFDLQYHTQDNQLLYSPHDWISGLTGETDLKKISQMWDVFKKQVSISNRMMKLPYLASDGKQRPRDFVPDVDLYAFAAHARALKGRGLMQDIKAFLAKSGAFADAVRREIAQKTDVPKLPSRDKRLMASKMDQGYSEDDAKTFLQLVHEGIPARKDLTAVLKLVVRGVINYGQATDTEYRAIFNMTARQIKELTGFKVARDGLTPAGRAIVTAAEIAVEMALNQYPALTFQEALRITEKICKAYGASVSQLEEVMGVSLVTGKPLLMGGRQ
jgi:hypothetical protein